MTFKGATPEQIDMLFTRFDKDGSGFIERAELLEVLRSLAKDLGIDDDECKASTQHIISLSNQVGTADNKISKDEFVKLLC
jgi:Ca2+-binding EF-hand superfamily protein